jgi:hypothetical protein
VFEVSLNAGPGGARSAFLREPTGREEVLLANARTLSISRLLDGLLVAGPESAVGVDSLNVSDRDLLVAELYARCYGDRIDLSTECRECGQRFGVDFSLAAFVAAALRRPEQELAVDGPDDDGAYHLPDGTRFRLPCVADERAVVGLPLGESVRALLSRCVLEGDLERCAEAVQTAMEGLAPPLSTEVRASCALCGAEQRVAFDMLSFFAAALAQERPLLVREVHCLARAYGWGHEEIMALPRSQRRDYVALVLAENEAARGGHA